MKTWGAFYMKHKKILSLFPGVFFAILLCVHLVNSIPVWSYYPFMSKVTDIIIWLGYAIIIYGFLTSHKDKVLFVGFSVLALGNVLIRYHSVFSIIEWLCVLLIITTHLTTFLPDFTKTAKQLWFVPALCAIGSGIISAITQIFYSLESISFTTLIESIVSFFRFNADSMFPSLVQAICLLIAMDYIVNLSHGRINKVLENSPKE